MGRMYSLISNFNSFNDFQINSKLKIKQTKFIVTVVTGTGQKFKAAMPIYNTDLQNSNDI